MDDLSALLNLSRSTGIDPDPQESAAWHCVAAPAVEAPWPLYANGCIFGAAADERVPVRFPVQRHHWL